MNATMDEKTTSGKLRTLDSTKVSAHLGCFISHN